MRYIMIVILCLSRREEKHRKGLDDMLTEIELSAENYDLIKSGLRKRKLKDYSIHTNSDTGAIFI